MEGKQHLIEEELIKKCLAGDRASQEMLYRKYASKMYGISLGYVSSRDDAKDILQEAFIKVFESLRKYNGVGSFEGWIRRIVVNTAIDFYRKEIKEQRNVKIDEVFEVKSEISTLDRINEKEILELIHKLPEGARIIFNLFVIEGYSHDEIAKMLDISLSTSKSQFWRAKGLLQSWINKMNDPQAEAPSFSLK